MNWFHSAFIILLKNNKNTSVRIKLEKCKEFIFDLQSLVVSIADQKYYNVAK